MNDSGYEEGPNCRIVQNQWPAYRTYSDGIVLDLGALMPNPRHACQQLEVSGQARSHKLGVLRAFLHGANMPNDLPNVGTCRFRDPVFHFFLVRLDGAGISSSSSARISFIVVSPS